MIVFDLFYIFNNFQHSNLPGVSGQQLSSSRPRWHAVFEVGWKEVVEENVLCAEGVRNLLQPERSQQGDHRFHI